MRRVWVELWTTLRYRLPRLVRWGRSQVHEARRVTDMTEDAVSDAVLERIDKGELR